MQGGVLLSSFVCCLACRLRVSRKCYEGQTHRFRASNRVRSSILIECRRGGVSSFQGEEDVEDKSGTKPGWFCLCFSKSSHSRDKGRKEPSL